jgi:hypothetical protein
MTPVSPRHMAVHLSQAGHRSFLARSAQQPEDVNANANANPNTNTNTNTNQADAFIELLEAFRATGGMAPGAMVARLLEEHQGGQAFSLAKRVSTRELFGFDWRSNFWVPMFQFSGDDMAVKAQPQQVRAALPSEWSGWAVACWFAAANTHLEGRRPVDALNLQCDAVLHAALMASQTCESGASAVISRH